ncbi:MAG: hypothetical protein C0171_04480 [Caldisphaera sp.]|uniref:hypothetical protein n=1 Tax=Caldisphaera sp. TaxID=2060322 RepID=UPI000CB73E17|nr:MAG: hypothetical protein C0171_04480 [Caldisphaera sp.]
MSEEKLTTNVLILELSTMIVAIALAFSAQSLSNSLTLFNIIEYIFVNIIVVWFWWRYIMDRFKYPVKRNTFPFYDVLLLIIISLLPEVLKVGEIFYLSGTLAALSFIWSLMLRSILNDYRSIFDEKSTKSIKERIILRIFLGLIFLISFIIGFVSIAIAHIIFFVTILVIIYNLVIELARAKINRKL